MTLFSVGLPDEEPIEKEGDSPPAMYNRLVQRGYLFTSRSDNDLVTISVSRPLGGAESEVCGALTFQRGKLWKIEAFSAGLGIGTALVGAAMAYYPRQEEWVVVTGIRDENGRIFLGHLASLPGIRVGVLRNGRTKYLTHGIRFRFAVPRRRWVLVPQDERVVSIEDVSDKSWSEAPALARKLIQRAVGNESELVIPSVFYDDLKPAIDSTRDYLIDPPVLSRRSRRLALDVKGRPFSHSPMPAVTATSEIYESVLDGHVDGIEAFLTRRGEPRNAARLLY